ncbi:peptide-methionine (S)-S-oxide reductase MsrA [Synechococcus elongatus]|uniref:Peptide methionine sulfoxide reductase MsrA n=2 Tax=Synechococcus elongatus TaxID=32046 RepID=Q31KF3_SYNE7|nr:peptide-methionine (S)-S-oxide reductase MsrA [Synechococcus elongatus]ABB58466.1 peptide methionine sulfoxide reductase [Synechococcus elongatus PCC 7942 = FACHB-805]AJD57073.1 peptide methionine sulfoxide reductase [Synechococcus elongatus UTEX 2973]MBD2587186.1 peptide-methionine (S)-S-oxide reductase MsrA [Synechococcus elongatus FACHB-242]MBD2688257.1 peptide-methionine (S)-S-oxide reductase MsrA [Synechococcus elongatus FACHB-1061]MBD2706032.1 peptide-methionine (S)-S-oxide reductase 
MKRLLVLGLLIASFWFPNTAAWAATAEAIFAGGCFWCVEADFDKVTGVTETISGYSGGTVKKPTYKQVSAGKTGHYESVKIIYDPDQVSYDQLVSYFLQHIDPLDGGGQFCDRGDQYRSAIFVTPEQQPIAEAAIAAAAQELGQPIQTKIQPAKEFWEAENYHQNYYQKQALLYKYYRARCGRDAQIAKVWGEYEQQS